MGGPAGVANAGFPSQRIVHQFIRQVDQFANRAATIQHAVVHGRNACAVIAAILKTLECFNQNGRDFVCAQYPYNTTHIINNLIDNYYKDATLIGTLPNEFDYLKDQDVVKAEEEDD